MKKRIIIGADYGGLSAAALAAKRGYSVKVIDKNSQTGGRSQLLKKDGFTFDMGPSAFLLYIGTDKKVDTILHHNLYLAENWKDYFDTIFRNPSMPENPSYYVSATSKTDSTAPEGCENVFVLVPIASGIEDNDSIRKEYSEKIIKHMSKTMKFDFEKHIRIKEIFSINDFKREYNSYKGTALGLSHALMQTAIFRLPYKSKKVDNHFYTGHYTHPGIGIPMVTISSKVLVDYIARIYG
ncbi:MAG: NAD(P)-binding protein [bacterium]